MHSHTTARHLFITHRRRRSRCVFRLSPSRARTLRLHDILYDTTAGHPVIIREDYRSKAKVKVAVNQAPSSPPRLLLSPRSACKPHDPSSICLRHRLRRLIHTYTSTSSTTTRSHTNTHSHLHIHIHVHAHTHTHTNTNTASRAVEPLDTTPARPTAARSDLAFLTERRQHGRAQGAKPESDQYERGNSPFVQRAHVLMRRYSHCGRWTLQERCLPYVRIESSSPPHHLRAPLPACQQAANRVVGHAGFPDPFAVATINGEQTKTTGVIKKTLNPYWNESFDMYASTRRTEPSFIILSPLVTNSSTL